MFRRVSQRYTAQRGEQKAYPKVHEHLGPRRLQLVGRGLDDADAGNTFVLDGLVDLSLLEVLPVLPIIGLLQTRLALDAIQRQVMGIETLKGRALLCQLVSQRLALAAQAGEQRLLLEQRQMDFLI